MKPKTTDYEHVLDLENVVAVEYDEDGDIVKTFVSKKKDENDLDDDQIVANNVDRDSDVEEIGDVRPLTERNIPRPLSGDRTTRVRPIPAGVSEAHLGSTAGTASSYPFKLDDGTYGRLSNYHVYAGADAEIGQTIIQPGPYDGGTEDDAVGELIAYEPLEDEGNLVDAAVRSIDNEQESYRYLGLQDNFGESVIRDDYSSLKNEWLAKTGRTTAVSQAVVKATSASVKVPYSDGTKTFRDQIMTGHMLDGGDSGSPVFRSSNGALVGLGWSGSDKVSFICKISHVENELDGQVVQRYEYPQTWWERLFDTLFSTFGIRRHGN